MGETGLHQRDRVQRGADTARGQLRPRTGSRNPTATALCWNPNGNVHQPEHSLQVCSETKGRDTSQAFISSSIKSEHLCLLQPRADTGTQQPLHFYPSQGQLSSTEKSCSHLQDKARLSEVWPCFKAQQEGCAGLCPVALGCRHQPRLCAQAAWSQGSPSCSQAYQGLPNHSPRLNLHRTCCTSTTYCLI